MVARVIWDDRARFESDDFDKDYQGEPEEAATEAVQMNNRSKGSEGENQAGRKDLP